MRSDLVIRSFAVFTLLGYFKSIFCVISKKIEIIWWRFNRDIDKKQTLEFFLWTICTLCYFSTCKSNFIFTLNILQHFGKLKLMFQFVVKMNNDTFLCDNINWFLFRKFDHNYCNFFQVLLFINMKMLMKRNWFWCY